MSLAPQQAWRHRPLFAWILVLIRAIMFPRLQLPRVRLLHISFRREGDKWTLAQPKRLSARPNVAYFCRGRQHELQHRCHPAGARMGKDEGRHRQVHANHGKWFSRVVLNCHALGAVHVIGLTPEWLDVDFKAPTTLIMPCNAIPPNICSCFSRCKLPAWEKSFDKLFMLDRKNQKECVGKSHTLYMCLERSWILSFPRFQTYKILRRWLQQIASLSQPVSHSDIKMGAPCRTCYAMCTQKAPHNVSLFDFPPKNMCLDELA